jgi:hypothetical protein
MSGSKLSDRSDPAASHSRAADASLRVDQPLDLAVHAMPAMPGLPTDTQLRTSWGRWKMTLIMLICAAPVLASYLAYYVVRPEARRLFGQLVEPQRPLPAVAASNLEGRPVDLRGLKGQWLLLSVAPSRCDDPCQRHLYLQRQLREGLGKDRDRVDWVWLVSDEAAPPAALLPALKSATVLHVPRARLEAWLEAAPGQAIDEHLFLVDPVGNLMMRFPARLDVEGAGKAKKDIERVLRASSSWDRPGR